MGLQTHSVCRLVKSEDLNHQGPLVAGKTAMGVVKPGFIAAAASARPENIVCVNIQGMLVKKTARNGNIIRLESKVVLASQTRLVSFAEISGHATGESYMDGFLSLVRVDKQGKASPHGSS